MLSASDDNIADEPWDENGGDSIVSRMIDAIGLTATRPPADPEQWGETLTCAVPARSRRTAPISTSASRTA